MFHVKEEILFVKLPQGKCQEELVVMAKEEIRKMIGNGVFYGKDIKINGRITTGMALLLGHELAHVCKSVSIFDPKENSYIRVIEH